MILIKCQIRSKYEWLRNSTPEKVFREFSPLIVLLALRNVRIFTVYGLNAISEPEPVLLCPGLRRQQLPALFRRRSSTTDYVGMGAGGGDIQVTKVQTVVKHHAAFVTAL